MKNYCGILVIATVINGFKTFEISDSDFQEYVSPKFTAVNPTDYFTYPDYLATSFQINGFDVLLNSKRKEQKNKINFDILDIPGIIRTKDGVYQTSPSSGNTVIEEYEDVEHQSLFLLQCKDTIDTCKMHGIFHFNEQQYSIQPVLTNSEDSYQKTHIVKMILSDDPIKTPLLLPFDSVLVEQSLTQTVYNPAEDKNPGSKVRRKRSLPGQYLAELYFVADYTMFEYFSTNFGGSVNALNYMLKYFKAVISEVQVRFDQMKKTVPGLDFDVVLIGYDIATDRQSSSWSSNNELTDGVGTYLDSGPARTAFETFLTQNIKVSNVTPDGVLAFTRRPLLVNTVNGYVQQAGIGWPSICSFPYNFQIITDPYSGNIGRQASHFLGQMMFMKTDENTPTCSETDDDMYIMSGNHDALFPTREKSSRPWEWSSCLNSFGAIAQTLSCLQDNRDGVVYNSISSSLTAGELFSIEEQCKLVYGANSTNCTAVQEDICFNGIGCINNGTCLNIVVKDGTTCGEGRWCHLGSCTDTPTTEAAPTTTPISTSTSTEKTSSTSISTTTTTPVVRTTNGPSNILGGTNPVVTIPDVVTQTSTNSETTQSTSTQFVTNDGTTQSMGTTSVPNVSTSQSESDTTSVATGPDYSSPGQETTDESDTTPLHTYTVAETSTPEQRTTSIFLSESVTTTILPTLPPTPKQCKIYLSRTFTENHRRRIGRFRNRWF